MSPRPGGDRRRRLGVGLEVGRAAYGLLELVAPARVAGAALRRPPGRGTRNVARLLGARHLVQAVLVLRAGDARAHRLGGALDAAHGASMVPWTALARQDRRFYVRSGVLAALLAWAEWEAAARSA